MLVERLQESNASLYKPALEQIRSLIRSSTTSMTSVPKPLKFMRLHYDAMKVRNFRILLFVHICRDAFLFFVLPAVEMLCELLYMVICHCLYVSAS